MTTSTYSKKICLIGEFAVGKTSLIRRFVESRFDDAYISTIGVKVSRRQLTLPRENSSALMTLMVWDLAGGEKFDRVTQSYYQGAAGAILICDLTRLETVDALANYAHDFRTVNPNASLVVVGNKVDMEPQRVVTDAKLGTVADRFGAPWFTASARSGANVETLFATIGALMLLP